MKKYLHIYERKYRQVQQNSFYLSVQRYEDPIDTHIALLSEEVVALEGLNLSSVVAGYYELVCLPLLVVSAEGAPARAILISDS